MSVQERKKESTLIEMGIIREDINFERSQDPKVAMGIGIKPEIVSLRKELSEMYDMAYEKIDDPHFAGMVGALDVAIQGIDNLSIMKDGNS